MIIDPQNAFLFFGSSLLLAAAPGPDNIFVLAQSTAHGWKTGVLVTLGLCTGLIFHTAAAALGLAAILKASPGLLRLIAVLGGAYLLYLAAISVKAILFSQPSEPEQKTARKSARSLYLRGIVMNITNPKVTLFFLAYLPQFVSPGYSPAVVQISAFGIIFMISALTVFSALSLGASALTSTFRSGSIRTGTILNLAVALVYIVLSARIFVSAAAL